MPQPILVTGGTGTLGRPVVQRLLDAGADVRVLSRRPAPPDPHRRFDWRTGDLRQGTGLQEALHGADTVVHCATNPRGDVQAAQRLIAEARRQGTPHLVYISIVGIDVVPFSYYRSKLQVERLIEASGLPWTILRATQFHNLLASAAGALARSRPVMPVPAHTSFQPIEVTEVAGRLAELALAGKPAERVPDMGGPEILTTRELAERFLRATGRRRRIVQVPLPGAAARGFRAGGHLAPQQAVGRRTFEEFVAAEHHRKEQART
jgi:uncharacterized protein YbjT (DUF2867 family)